MDSSTGRLLAVVFGLLPAVGAYAAYPSVALAGFTGVFWTATGLLARRNWAVVQRRGSRWAGVHGGLSALAALGAFTVASSLSMPVGFGFALGLFVLGVANATAGAGVEMANAAASR